MTTEERRQVEEAARNIERRRQWQKKRIEESHVLDSLAEVEARMNIIAGILPEVEGTAFRAISAQVADFATELETMIIDRVFSEHQACKDCVYRRATDSPVPYGDQTVSMPLVECAAPYPGACPEVARALHGDPMIPHFLRKQAD